MKVVELDTFEPLGEKALGEAMAYVEKEPHGGWADLVVHQSQILLATRLVTKHNGHDPQVRLRAMCETRFGHNDWRVQTRSIEVRVWMDKKP